MYGLSESTNLINGQSANSDRLKTTYTATLGSFIAPTYPIPPFYQPCSYTGDTANFAFQDTTGAQIPPKWQQANICPNSTQLSAITISTNSASEILYRQLWEQKISQRFQEARQRYPEFFPCFELKESVKGLQYSIYFKPLTQYAQTLASNTSVFPHYQTFKPIEQLWQEDGQSELDRVFERFPTQIALELPKEPWGARCKQLFSGLVDRGLELLHVDSIFLRKNPGI